MENKEQKSYKWLIPYLAVLGVAILVLVAVVFFVKPASKKNKQYTDEEAASSETAAETKETGSESVKTEAETIGSSAEEKPSESLTEETETEEETEYAAVPAIDIAKIEQLIDRYYSAKINNDADELNKIVDTEVPYDVASLSEETQFICKYDSFSIIVVPGISEKYFIAYVKYDIYFNGIETGAASLNHFIIAKEDDGSYYIYDRGLSGEFKSYLEETENSEKIMKIKEQVETELSESCEKDADLRYLIEMLKGTD